MVFVLAMGSVSLLAASPAAADPPTIDCGTDPGNTACTHLEPVLTCVWTNTDGSLIAVFGYNNSSSNPIVVAAGSSNGFSPAPLDRGQVTSFPIGRVTSAFTVAWSSGSITWTLIGRTRTASGSTAKCPSQPAPALGEAGVILGFLVVAVILSAFVFRERGAPRAARLFDRVLPR